MKKEIKKVGRPAKKPKDKKVSVCFSCEPHINAKLKAASEKEELPLSSYILKVIKKGLGL